MPSYLDEGLWSEILKRLPVDVLCRFRCVCSSWNSLISSPSFVRAQYLSSSSNSIESKSYILFDTQIECSTEYAFYNPDQLSQSISQHSVTFQIVPFDRDFCDIGVIHGVVCLSLEVYPDDFDDPDDCVSGHTILWNPTIRKFVKILRSNSMIDVGFGFDGCKNDFKVIRTDSNREKPTVFEVYSYPEGRSRTVDSDHIGPFDLVSRYSCYKNSAIHWIIRRRNWPMTTEILMFDCKTEELKTMELPQPFNQRDVIVKPGGVFVRSGKVSVLEATKAKEDDKAETALWVMEEYGLARSWKKTAYHKDIAVRITQNGIFKLENGYCNCWGKSNSDEGIKRSQQPWNGHVFEPSMLLMDTDRVIPRATWKMAWEVSFRVIDE